MTRLECIKSNAFLLGLNMNKATKEQKIQWLCQMIDNETDKPEDEMDFALIDECSAYLRELSDKAAEAPKEQKQRILQQIKAHHNQTAQKSAKVLHPSWKTPRKIIAIAATIVLLLALTLTVIAKVNGYSNAWEYVRENLQKIIGLDAGDRVNEGNITLIKGEESIAYSSIEELMQTEGYDILYPATLPEGIEITKVSQQIVNEDYTLFSVQFNDPNLSIVISTKRNILAEDLEEYTPYPTAAMTFYLEKTPENSYQAVGYDARYEYLICSDNYDVLVEILNNMKGLE